MKGIKKVITGNIELMERPDGLRIYHSIGQSAIVMLYDDSIWNLDAGGNAWQVKLIDEKGWPF